MTATHLHAIFVGRKKKDFKANPWLYLQSFLGHWSPRRKPSVYHKQLLWVCIRALLKRTEDGHADGRSQEKLKMDDALRKCWLGLCGIADWYRTGIGCFSNSPVIVSETACRNEDIVGKTDTVSMTTGIFLVFLICVELLYGIRTLSGTALAPRRTSLWGTHVLSLMRCSIVLSSSLSHCSAECSAFWSTIGTFLTSDSTPRSHHLCVTSSNEVKQFWVSAVFCQGWFWLWELQEESVILFTSPSRSRRAGQNPTAVCKDKNNPLSKGCFRCCPRFPPDETYQTCDPG